MIRINTMILLTRPMLLVGFLWFTKSALAGPYHFSDVLIGDRAMGMGAAFAGVADDSSALFYNPAGLGYAASTNLSAAVNAFQYTNREYQKVFAGKKSFYEDSQDIIPPFTGGVIDLKKISEGLHGAFTLQNLTQQSTNQNDFIRLPEINLDYLHRAEKSQLSELVFSVGAGKRINSNIALGLSLGGRQLSFNSQQFQDVTQKVNPKYVKLTDAVGASKSLFQSRSRNGRVTASAVSIETGSGIIWAPIPWLSFGLSGHSDFIVKQSISNELDEMSIYHYNDLTLPSAADFEALASADAELAKKQIEDLSNKTMQRITSNNSSTAITYKNAPVNRSKSEGISLGRSRFRLGVAAFPSSKLMFTFDVTGYHSQTEWIVSSAVLTENVFNFHQGMEYFFTPHLFVRQGLFTNFDARPEELNLFNNGERIDFAGTSLFFGTQTSESQFSLGGIYQYGWGRALKLEGQTVPTKIREDRFVAAFTASHGL